MNPGGIVIVIAAVWLGCQVFGGNALQRVGIVPNPGNPGPMPSASGAVAVTPTTAAPPTAAGWT